MCRVGEKQRLATSNRFPAAASADAAAETIADEASIVTRGLQWPLEYWLECGDDKKVSMSD